MQTANKADENIRKLAAMFPNAVAETINENGEVVRAIDKDVLMQEIACTVVDANEECYQFTWPDKKKSVLLTNALINKTLCFNVAQFIAFGKRSGIQRPFYCLCDFDLF